MLSPAIPPGLRPHYRYNAMVIALPFCLPGALMTDDSLEIVPRPKMDAPVGLFEYLCSRAASAAASAPRNWPPMQASSMLATRGLR
jgi:hypothetical protein